MSEEETIAKQIKRQKELAIVSNRRFRFKELLGGDYEYLDAFIMNTQISPWDVKILLDRGCPKELISEILL